VLYTSRSRKSVSRTRVARNRSSTRAAEWWSHTDGVRGGSRFLEQSTPIRPPPRGRKPPRGRARWPRDCGVRHARTPVQVEVDTPPVASCNVSVGLQAAAELSQSRFVRTVHQRDRRDQVRRALPSN
jgi:hypothetical protein